MIIAPGAASLVRSWVISRLERLMRRVLSVKHGGGFIGRRKRPLHRRLKTVMRTFPKMPECTNCGDCCGPVSARLQEIAKIKAFIKRRGIAWEPHLNVLTCGFLNRETGHCRIYSVRPVACRMYGVVRELACPHFPQAARLSFPAKAAVRSGLMGMKDKLLAEVFAVGAVLEGRETC